jgi:hypothetical protein
MANAGPPLETRLNPDGNPVAHRRTIVMNRITYFAVSALLLVSSSSAYDQTAASRSANVCLNVREIQRTETPDDRTIIFHMRDGKVWSNRLKTVCPMLKVSSFTQVLRSGDLVCSNQQFIHVTLTGDDCSLGEFSPVATQR